jgi:D-tyrosyl-tRNA(Tyr) deacylase
MKAVVTRVSRAAVRVESEVVGEIGTGLLVLVGATHDDTPATADALATKIANLRIMRDGARDESSVLEVAGGVLVVSQFTLYGDVRKGRRPSWTAAAPGQVAEPLVERVIETLRTLGLVVATGRFGAMMEVDSVNDGPFTVLLEMP